MSKISVFIKEPGKNPRHVSISNTLENLQKTVGGYIETFMLPDNLVGIVNEEGLLTNLPFNEVIGGNAIYGTIIFCGVDLEEEDFSDVPMKWADFRESYEYLFRKEVP